MVTLYLSDSRILLKNGIKNTVSGIYNTVKDGFNKAVEFIKGLASSAFSWGADIINGIVDGIKSCISKVTDAVSDVAADMVINPQVSAAQMSGGYGSNGNGGVDNSISSILSGIREMVDSLSGQNAGIISIPVYLGNLLLDGTHNLCVLYCYGKMA